ncbi:MAG: sodium:solute symporter family protein [bacterium]|nr:sodium:solute symporter family protein [bacterium]
MNTWLFLTVLGVLSIFYCLMGLLASKKIKNVTDYFVAGRNLGLFPVIFTLVATQIGGGMLLGTSESAYTFGLFGILYTLGMALGFIILSLGIAAKLQSFNIITTAEIFYIRYKSPTLYKFASILSVLTMCGILFAQILGAKTLLAGIGIHNEFIFITFWILVIAYTMIGGLKAVVVADTFQVIFIILVFSGLFFYSLYSLPDTFFGSIFSIQKSFTTIQFNRSQFISILLMPALFSLIEQDLAQKFFAARTRAIATFAALISGLFLITFSLVPIFFGMQAKLLNLNIPAGCSPLMVVISLLTNDFFLILATCGIIAAITSTSDSLLCAISSNIAQTFDFNWTGLKNKVRLSQIITLVAGIITLGVSYFIPSNIITILIESYALSVNCLLVPLLFAYYRTDVKKAGAVGAIACGLIGFVFIPFWNTSLPKELLPLTLSFIGFIIGSRWKK